MALDVLKMIDVIEALENYIAKVRPPLEMRKELDISYKIDNQSVIIFEIRPRYDKPEVYLESPVAKTTYIHVKHHWKIFWMRADLKWHNYQPKSFVKSINEFLKIVEEDKHGCFWS